MAEHNELGKLGEKLAKDFLAAKGYQILEQNWVCGHKEIDIIAMDGKELVIVEVKTRSSTDWGDPEDFVTDRKIKRIVNSADAYIRYNCLDLDVRFDIISVIFEEPN